MYLRERHHYYDAVRSLVLAFTFYFAQTSSTRENNKVLLDVQASIAKVDSGSCDVRIR